MQEWRIFDRELKYLLWVGVCMDPKVSLEVLDVNSEAKIKHFYFIYSQITGIKQTSPN